jgi:hypothetical protein
VASVYTNPENAIAVSLKFLKFVRCIRWPIGLSYNRVYTLFARYECDMNSAKFVYRSGCSGLLNTVCSDALQLGAALSNSRRILSDIVVASPPSVAI